jgi:uncharacterized protein YfaS (alpha-2-macroglobulin family)
VYHFALAAKDNGYYNAEQLLSKSKTYQINKARRFSVTNNKNFSSDMLTQAYRLYTLAYAGSPETGAMNRLKENKYIPSTAIYLLSAAYAMNGQDKASQDLIAKVGKIPSDKKYPHNLTFGSELRDQAIALIAYSQLKNKENAEKLAQKLADKLNKQGVYSTQTTAFALFALSSFMSENQADVKMIEISVNDKVTEKIQFQNHGFSKTLKSEGENNLVVKNTGSADVVVNIIKKGIPAPGNEAAKTSTLKVVRTFTDQNGKSIKPDAIKQGSDFRMSVTVTNSGANGNLENIALNQLIPSGWEILNERLFFGQDYGVETDFTYQDIRDDRVYTFFNLKVGESKTFTFRLNAAYLGEYYLPATLVEAMYEPEVSTLLKGMNVKVVK